MHPRMLGDDLTFGANHDAFSVYAHTDRAVGERGNGTLYAVTARRRSRQVGETRLVCSTKPSNGAGMHIRCAALIGPDLGDRALGLLGVMDLVPKLPAALLEPHVHLTQLAQTPDASWNSRGRASWTFFSTWPFSHPAPGVQNCASNRKWLAMRLEPGVDHPRLPLRPTRSTAVLAC